MDKLATTGTPWPQEALKLQNVRSTPHLQRRAGPERATSRFSCLTSGGQKILEQCHQEAPYQEWMSERYQQNKENRGIAGRPRSQKPALPSCVRTHSRHAENAHKRGNLAVLSELQAAPDHQGGPLKEKTWFKTLAHANNASPKQEGLKQATTTDDGTRTGTNSSSCH